MADENDNMIRVYKPHSLDHTDFSVRFFGTLIFVTVTSIAGVAQQWIDHIVDYNKNFYSDNRLIAGFAVQWASGQDNALTLQICVGWRCLIYQLQRVESFPENLRLFLLSPAVTLVRIHNENDALRLLMSRHTVRVNNLIELELQLRRENGESLARASLYSFSKIVEVCLGCRGVSFKNCISQSNWNHPFLTHHQVRQATVNR